jgi:hypothetical protein
MSVIQPVSDQNEIKTVNIIDNGQIVCKNDVDDNEEKDKNQNEILNNVKNPSGFLDEQNLTELNLNLNITVNNDKNGG